MEWTVSRAVYDGEVAKTDNNEGRRAEGVHIASKSIPVIATVGC